MKLSMHPHYKVTVTHTGAARNFTNTEFPVVRIKRRENNYDTATLTCSDRFWSYYGRDINKLDDVKVYLKDMTESSYPSLPQFGGTIRKVAPNLSVQGYVTELTCKGYGAAFESTFCNRDYGAESSNPTYPRPWNMWVNVVADFVKKSYAGAATNWDLDTTDVTNTFATDITYINNPYRRNIDLVNFICDLTSAIGAGAAPGAHWIVDNSATPKFLVAKIGDHTAGTDAYLYWPDWWEMDAAHSTLTEGVDLKEFHVYDSSEEFANKVVLITDFRRPSYDFWTENQSGLWGTDNITALSDENGAGLFIVGDYSLKVESKTASTGYIYYPSTENAGWDTSAWGSSKTVPRLNFYSYKLNANLTIKVLLFTTDHKTDYFYIDYPTLYSDPFGSGDWVHHSIPIGPYWSSTDDAKEYDWTPSGGAEDWTDINGISFEVDGIAANGIGYLDDLHFNGKIARSAYWSGTGTAHNYSIDSVGEYQKVFIAQVAMDDSCVVADDSGIAAQIAYAELLRRMAQPVTVTFFTVGVALNLMAGQKLHVRAGRRVDGTYLFDDDMRVVELEHVLTAAEAYTSVTATTDLYNAHPVSVPDQYSIWKENTLVNSKEATDIRASSEVDLLISLMEKDYG